MTRLLSLLLPLLMLLAFLITTYGIGRKALKLFRLELDELEEYLLATALGASLIMFFTLLLSLTNLIYREAYIVLAAAAMAFSTKETKHLMRKLAMLLKGIRQGLTPSPAGILLLAYLFFIAAIGIATLAPVSEFDSMAYHLAFAKTYANNHGFVYQPTQLFTTMPQGMTMLYAIAELFNAPNLSSMIAYTFGILASLAIYSMVRKQNSETAAITASLLFFTAPALIERLPQTMVDVSLTYFFLTAVIVILKYVKGESANWTTAALAAILIGTATTIKITGALSAAAAGIVVSLSSLLNKRKVNLKQVALFAAIVAAMASPWLAMSYVYTGNPVYPQAQSIFGGKYLDESLAQLYANYHQSVGLDRTIFNAITVPWSITFNSKAFDQILGLTPFFIMILPLALLFRRQMKDTKAWLMILAMGLAILMIGFWMHPAIRYMFPGIALLSIATGTVMDAMMKNRLLKMAIFGMLIASLTFNAAIWYGINAKNVHYLASGEQDADYYAALKDHNSYGAQQWINANTPKDAVVMLFNEPRGYFLDRRYLISSPFQTYIDYNNMDSSAELLKRLNEINVTYILVNDDFFDTYSLSIEGSAHVNELLRSLVKENAQLMYEKNKIRVYKIWPQRGIAANE